MMSTRIPSPPFCNTSWRPLIIFLFWVTVSGRVYEPCCTKDDREGLCVALQYCREALSADSRRGLVSGCNRIVDNELVCCPLPESVMSAGRSRYSARESPCRPDAGSTARAPSGAYPFNPPHDPTGRRGQQNKDSRQAATPSSSPPRSTRRPEARAPVSRTTHRPNRPSSTRGSHSRSTTRRMGSQGRKDEQHYRGQRHFPSQFEGCGKNLHRKIAGGEESDPQKWPWMVAIFKRSQDLRQDVFQCGGALISRRFILTAAHCLIKNYVILPSSTFYVRVGSVWLYSGEMYSISKLFVHENHTTENYFNDIALMMTSTDVMESGFLGPVCLPIPAMATNSFIGWDATVTGWGDTAFRAGGSERLHEVTIPVVSNDECSAAYSRVRGAGFLARGASHVVCAGLRQGGKDACVGDSGGPLMVNYTGSWVVIGIVSLGYKCAEPGYPGVYTRVTHYLPWIEATMKTS